MTTATSDPSQKVLPEVDQVTMATTGTGVDLPAPFGPNWPSISDVPQSEKFLNVNRSLLWRLLTPTISDVDSVSFFPWFL